MREEEQQQNGADVEAAVAEEWCGRAWERFRSAPARPWKNK